MAVYQTLSGVLPGPGFTLNLMHLDGSVLVHMTTNRLRNVIIIIMLPIKPSSRLRNV
jgi:hypothetical protein